MATKRSQTKNFKNDHIQRRRVIKSNYSLKPTRKRKQGNDVNANGP